MNYILHTSTKSNSSRYLKFLFLAAMLLFIASCKTSSKVSKPAEPSKSESTATATPAKPEVKKDTVSVVIPSTVTDLQKKYAQKLAVAPSTLTNTKLLELIDKWWGARYTSPPGATPEEGIDCSGFAALTQRTIYGKSVQGSAADISKRCKKISSKELKEGDLVFFCCTRNSDEREKITHVGVYLTNRMFVHATTHGGVLISSLDDPEYWQAKFVKAGRLKGDREESEPTNVASSDVASSVDNSTTTTTTTSSSSSDAEIGRATYYADSFEGKKTFNGEIFQQSKLTAAHKTLPFGTTVRVTNLKNNKSSVVVINDRLPKKSKNTIDLSKAAALEIDLIRDGVANVRIEVIK